jgi:hypothetical protein
MIYTHQCLGELVSFLNNLLSIQVKSIGDEVKMKAPACLVLGAKARSAKARNRGDGSSKATDWEPPPMGWIKVNVDGAYTEESGKVGVGVVIRDHVGNIILTA